MELHNPSLMNFLWCIMSRPTLKIKYKFEYHIFLTNFPSDVFDIFVTNDLVFPAYGLARICIFPAVAVLASSFLGNIFDSIIHHHRFVTQTSSNQEMLQECHQRVHLTRRRFLPQEGHPHRYIDFLSVSGHFSIWIRHHTLIFHNLFHLTSLQFPL